MLFVPASGGEGRDFIYILRLIHERESERSGSGGELHGDTRGKTVR
jgi:hypothetical protein